MKGHTDCPTGLRLSPDGGYVASNAMDNTSKLINNKYELKSYCLKFKYLIVRVWDIRPFATQERCVNILMGHSHNFEKVTYYFIFFL